jgi:O-antigen/teichoic acid export membrane protein
MTGALYDRYLKPAAERLPPFLRGPIAQGAISSMALRVFNLSLGFCTALLLARLLGAEGYGVFAFGSGTALLFATLARSGLQTFLVRSFAATSHSAHALRNGALHFGLAVAIVSSLFAALIGLAVFAAGGAIDNPALRQAAFVSALAAPAAAIAAVSQGVLRGRMKFVRAYAPEFVIVQAATLLGVFILHLAGALTALSALLCFTAAWAGAAAIGLRWMSAALPPPPGAKPEIPWRTWSITVGAMTLGGLVVFLTGRIEMAALAAFAGPAEIGIYAIALRFAFLTTFPGFALSAGFAPTLSRLAATNDRKPMARRIALAARTTSIGALGAAVLAIALTWILLPLIDAEFVRARMAVVIMALGFTVQAMSGRPFEILSMLGFARITALTSIIGIVVGVMLMFVLIPAYGAVGAAAATAVVAAAHSILLAVLVRMKIGLRCDLFGASLK